ncbi:MAG: VIT domain-containing protein [Anaerolineales bacterium]|jgi:Ca-activated chloride channel family protein
MKKKQSFLILTIALALILLAVPSPALADGIIIPEPPPCPFPPCAPVPVAQLAIKYHRVEVTIEDQLAVTHVDQVFYNPNDREIEGTYIFPIPEGATVTKFILWMDNEPVKGKVLEADEAREIYEDIVREMRDPALLEYAGRGALQATIFPIPPRGERRIELEYSEVLMAENGLVRYVYPLNTEKFSVWPLEDVSVSVEIESSQPIRAVYSPTHSVDIEKDDPYDVRVGYEDEDVTPDTDFGLYYSIGESEAFHLLSYRDPDDPDDDDGFFMLLLAPKPEVEPDALPKDVILVLDKSGSMDGEKFNQAQEALHFILDNLNPDDRFNIISFSTGIEAYASRLRSADEANEAQRWVDGLSAAGSTDINRALLEAADLADGEHPTYLIFLTDGLPTEGEVDSDDILENLEDAAPKNLRLFAFGVGYDVDTFLLDSLAQAHHGTSTYVLPGEDLDEIISAFYEKISTPVLTDLELDFGGLRVYDVYPDPLPDLFSGSQIVVMGRYRKGGAETIRLEGVVDQKTETFTFRNQQFDKDSRGASDALESLPRLWATRKIGYLLNHIRLHGADKESIEQIVSLSIRYGIVTEYTSYLVTEPKALGGNAWEGIAAEEYDRSSNAPTAPSYGQDAVEKAAGQSAMAEAEAPLESPDHVEGVTVSEVVQNVGAQSFVYVDGVWTDTRFDPDTMKTKKVAFLSDDYFDLVAARPELAAAFALGEQVIAFADGTAYEVVSEDESGDRIDVPEAYPTPEEDEYEPGGDNNDEELPDADDPTSPGNCLFTTSFVVMGLVGVYVKRRR